MNRWMRFKRAARGWLPGGAIAVAKNIPVPNKPQERANPSVAGMGAASQRAPSSQPVTAPAAPVGPWDAARAAVFRMAQQAANDTSGKWGHPALNEYQNKLRHEALRCELTGAAQAAAAAAMTELARGWLMSVRASAGGPGEPSERGLAATSLAKFGELAAGPKRKGCAWAALAHFKAVDAAFVASSARKLAPADWQGWQEHLGDSMGEHLAAARGIAHDFNDNIWSSKCATQLNWMRSPTLHEEGWDHRPGTLGALELMALLSNRKLWLGAGGGALDGPKLALGLAAHEEQHLLLLAKALAARRKRGEPLPDHASEAQRWLGMGRDFCATLGRAAAATPAGREEVLGLAGQLRASLGSLGRGQPSHLMWAGMEKSTRALGNSPWIVAWMVGAGLGSEAMASMRNRAGESLGGMLNAALAEAAPEGSDPGGEARDATAKRWLEEGVCDMLESSPDGAAMLVPKVDAMRAGATEAVRVKAEQVEIERAAPLPAEQAAASARRL